MFLLSRTRKMRFWSLPESKMGPCAFAIGSELAEFTEFPELGLVVNSWWLSLWVFDC